MSFPSVVLFASMLWFAASIFTQVDVLHPTNSSSLSLPAFGVSVAISSDGARALVGADGDNTEGNTTGAAYVFDVNISESRDWMRQAILYPSNRSGQPGFGISVALSSNGTRVLIGASGDDQQGLDAGAAYVFDVDPSNASDWTEEVVLFPSDGTGQPEFGKSVALSSDGTRALIGAPQDDTEGSDVGATYIFDVNPTDQSDWIERTILLPNNGTPEALFGWSLAISSDGTRALVGASKDRTKAGSAGAAYVFDVNPIDASDWTLGARLYPSTIDGQPQFGYSVALSSDGTRALVGAWKDDSMRPDAGAAYIFDVDSNNANEWIEQAILTLYPYNGTGDSLFGVSVALSSDGIRALVGAYEDDTQGVHAGATYVFEVPSTNGIKEQAILYPRNGSVESFFGASVALSSDGSLALVGADNFSGQGAAFAYSEYPDFDPNRSTCVTTIGDQPITLAENETLIIDGDLIIQPNASITLTLSGSVGDPFIVVSGCASFGGTLTINVSSVILEDGDDDTIDVSIATYNGGLCANSTTFDEIIIEGSDCYVVEGETYGDTSLDVLLTTNSNAQGCSKGSSSKDTDYLPFILGAIGVASVACCLVGVVVVVVCLCGALACAGVFAAPLAHSKARLSRLAGQQGEMHGGAVNFDVDDL